MASKVLNTRIRSKIDYLANWISNTTFKPLLGEICIAIIPRNTSGTSTDPLDGEAYIGHGLTDSLGVTGVEGGPRANVGLTPYAIGIKVGDGINNFTNLPWIQAIAGDVYAWAKHSSIVNDETRADLQALVSGTVGDSNTLYRIRSGNDNKYYLQKKDYNEANYSDVQDSVIDLSSILSNLTGAMHFIGFSTSVITDGGSQSPTINDEVITTLNNGDVVIYQETQENTSGTNVIVAKEFVWTGTNWELLGDENSYVLKGSITNADIASNANIDQSKINGLTSNLNNLTSALNNLATIAETGSIYDIEESNSVSNVNFLVLDCGSATTLINNIDSTTGEWEV